MASSRRVCSEGSFLDESPLKTIESGREQSRAGTHIAFKAERVLGLINIGFEVWAIASYMAISMSIVRDKVGVGDIPQKIHRYTWPSAVCKRSKGHEEYMHPHYSNVGRLANTR